MVGTRAGEREREENKSESEISLRERASKLAARATESPSFLESKGKRALLLLPFSKRIALSSTRRASPTRAARGTRSLLMQRNRRTYTRGGGGGARGTQEMASSPSSSTLLAEESSASTNAALLPNLSRLLASASPVVALRSPDRSFELSDVWYEQEKRRAAETRTKERPEIRQATNKKHGRVSRTLRRDVSHPCSSTWNPFFHSPTRTKTTGPPSTSGLRLASRSLFLSAAKER